MPVLDTSFLSDLQEGRPEARRALARLRGDGTLVVPHQAALEFLSGFADPVQALHFLRQAFRVVHPTDEHLVAGARLRLRQRHAGLRPGWGDVQIATQALLDATYVVTADAADFRALGCRVWNHRLEAAPPAG